MCSLRPIVGVRYQWIHCRYLLDCFKAGRTRREHCLKQVFRVNMVVGRVNLDTFQQEPAHWGASYHLEIKEKVSDTMGHNNCVVRHGTKRTLQKTCNCLSSAQILLLKFVYLLMFISLNNTNKTRHAHAGVVIIAYLGQVLLKRYIIRLLVCTMNPMFTPVCCVRHLHLFYYIQMDKTCVGFSGVQNYAIVFNWQIKLQLYLYSKR